jgi:hypothetical protein
MVKLNFSIRDNFASGASAADKKKALKNKYVNWDTLLPRISGGKYLIRSSAYATFTASNTLNLIEVFVDFKTNAQTYDTSETNVTASIGFMKQIGLDAAANECSYVLETTDGNELTIGHPNSIVDVYFQFLDGTQVTDTYEIINYCVCLEFEEIKR